MVKWEPEPAKEQKREGRGPRPAPAGRGDARAQPARTRVCARGPRIRGGQGVEKAMWEMLKKTEKPILLYGMGDGAEKILAELNRREIPAAGVFASEGFTRGQEFAGFPVMDYRAAEEKYGEMVVLVCFGTHRPEVMAQIERLAARQELYAPDVPVAGETLFTREYAAAHRAELEKVYDLLADERSRKVLENVTAYKLSGRIDRLRACETDPAEAWENLLRPGREEHYLDLGAYTGDTIAEFIRYAGAWRRITALEPDPVTFAKLEKNTAGLHDCILYRLGAYSRYARLPFAGGAGRGSHLAETGVMTELDSVDNILCGQAVSLIKMDVEGMESEAIAGMAKTLRRHRPRLLISAYHRSEDLWRLPLEILEIRPDYKVYLRHHPCLPAWDVNYYFV